MTNIQQHTPHSLEISQSSRKHPKTRKITNISLRGLIGQPPCICRHRRKERRELRVEDPPTSHCGTSSGDHPLPNEPQIRSPRSTTSRRNTGAACRRLINPAPEQKPPPPSPSEAAPAGDSPYTSTRPHRNPRANSRREDHAAGGTKIHSEVEYARIRIHQARRSDEEPRHTCWT